MSSRAEIAVLLSHTRWVGGLARRLARDAHLAEDLVQDTFVKALEHPPDVARPLRGWLATLLRHRARDTRRERARRTARETSVARDEALPATDEIVERAEHERLLVRAVLELDEPYRTTVLLRFFDELPQREIARRMHTTSATVNSRLTRALERLRDRLAGEGGDRTAWLRVVLPLVRKPDALPWTALGATAVKVASFVAVFVSIVVGFALWSARPDSNDVSSSSAAVREELPSAEAEARPQLDLLPAVSTARAATPALDEAPSPPTVSAAPVASTADATLHGRVLDTEGRGVSGVPLTLLPRAATRAGPRSEAAHEAPHATADGDAASSVDATSGANGWFEIARHDTAERVVSADPRLATVLAGSARVRTATPSTVVVAPAIPIAGLVVDESNAPLAGAHVELRLPPAFGAEWGQVLDYTVPQRWSSRSGADGRFDLGAVPFVAGSKLTATLGGFVAYVEDASETAHAALRLVLRRPRATKSLVRGVVVDLSGAPVAGARVSAGAETAVSQREGEFALDVSRDGTGTRILAVKRGFEPARFEIEAAGWPEFVVLTLRGPTRSLHGRVVDDDGRAVAGARVWIDDPTYFGRVGEVRVVAETLARGDESFWSFATSDEHGAFGIEGIFDRAYRLQAIDPTTLASVESAPVDASASPIELVLPTNDLYPRVAGHVLARDGTPLAGVSVRLDRVTYELAHETGTDNETVQRGPVITDAAGAFAFADVPKHDILVTAAGDTILFAGVELDDTVDPKELRIVASRRVHVQFALDEPVDRADSVRLLDASGGRVLLRVMRGGGAHASFEAAIVGGSTEVLAVDEDASVALFYRGETEVARASLHLVPSELNVVRH